MTQGEISGLSRQRAAWWSLLGLNRGFRRGPERHSGVAQSPAPVTIGAAIEAAIRDFPAVTEATARAAAATEAINESQAAYLPRLDALWQLNRASRNNVFGLLLPQSIVPPISGPVLGTDTFESAWGSAAGLALLCRGLRLRSSLRGGGRCARAGHRPARRRPVWPG